MEQKNYEAQIAFYKRQLLQMQERAQPACPEEALDEDEVIEPFLQFPQPAVEVMEVCDDEL